MRRTHFWLWLFQRISALLILPAVFIHMIILHFVNPNDIIDINDYPVRFKGFLFLIVDSFLLYAGLFHGFNGIRNIVYDYVSKESNRKVAVGLIAASGIAVLTYGMYGLAYLMLRVDATQASKDLARGAATNITMATTALALAFLVAAYLILSRDPKPGTTAAAGGGE
jgi:succinate dehydrogenase hydrophobic anchor subunit